MLKKLLLAIAAVIATMGIAFAAVEVNKADQASLETIKGIGPKTSKAIVDERKKGGDFKDWADLEKRVKGIGDKSAAKMSQEGLTVNGQSMPNAAPTAAKAGSKAGATTSGSSAGESKSSASQKSGTTSSGAAPAQK